MTTPVELALDRALVALIARAFPFSHTPLPAAPVISAWDALLVRAQYHGLNPLLYAALQAQPRDDVPASVLQNLGAVYRGAVLANAKKYFELDALVQETDAAQLSFLLLKGAALAKWLYPEPGLRPFGDVDILIQQNELPRLQTMLETREYRASDELANGFREAYYSEAAFSQMVPPFLALDVHWHMFVPLYFRTRMNVQWFWAHTQTLILNTRPVLILDPTAQLLHLTVHASLNHRHAPRLLWLYDLALLLSAQGDAIDWDAAAAFAQTSQVTRSVHDILVHVEQRWGVRAPAPFMQTLKHTRISAAERIAFALTATEQNHARVLSDALAAPGWPNKLRYAAQHLVPSPAYMTSHYQIRHPILLPMYYLYRFFLSTWKLLRSLAATLAR